MSKSTAARSRTKDVPYDAGSKASTDSFWSQAVAHDGVAELRAKRGRPPKPEGERKEQISLRVDEDVLEWYRAQGPGWQTRMNAVLKAFRNEAVSRQAAFRELRGKISWKGDLEAMRTDKRRR